MNYRFYVIPFVLLLLNAPANSKSAVFPDCILLYNSNSVKDSDINFKYIAKFYGLEYKEISLNTFNINDSIFRNGNNYVKSIYIDFKNLGDIAQLDSLEINIMKNAIYYGSNLFIAGINDSCSLYNIKLLTDSAFISTEFITNNEGWHFSDENDSITSSFTNSVVISGAFKNAFSIQALNNINLLTDVHQNNTIFSYIQYGEGKIFFDGNIITKNIEDSGMSKLYNTSNLNNILPMMMFLRYSNGNRCWHKDNKYANLTIDDPYFIEPYGQLIFHDLLYEMELHNFHTTIAYIPKHFDWPQDSFVISLFRNYQDKFSIVQHGNNHDGYEFICYTQEQLDSLNKLYNNRWINQIPRPFDDQECDIVEGLTRMYELSKKTGIEFGKIMIFPDGISLSPTLGLLKMYNFNATVNLQTHPYLYLQGDSDTNYDFDMRPANMNFRDFPAVSRRHPCSSYDPLTYSMGGWKYTLFLDKPLLLYSHHNKIFKFGIDKFNPVADSINKRFPGIEWRSLDYIIKRMYLERVNLDSSIDVLFYGNDIVLSNETSKSRIYHLKKYEILNVPILSITVDNQPINYYVKNDTLGFDIEIPPLEEKNIIIEYSSGDKDFALNSKEVSFDTLNNKLEMMLSNYGKDGGACPLGVYALKGGKKKLLRIASFYVDASESTSIEISLGDTFESKNKLLCIELDPFGITHDKNNMNNIVYESLGTRVDLDIYNDSADVVNNTIDFDSIPAGSLYISKEFVVSNTFSSNPDTNDGPSSSTIDSIFLSDAFLTNGKDTLRTLLLEDIPDSLPLGATALMRLALFIPEGKTKGIYSGYVKIAAIGTDSTMDFDSIFVIAKGPYAPKTLNALKVFPNFLCAREENLISFKGVTENSQVSIYDISGRKVWTKKEKDGDGLITWHPNVKNGVYVYIVKDKAGEVKKGKLIIIR